MTRNDKFHPEREPFRADDSLELQHEKINGPVAFLNPTRAEFRNTSGETTSSDNHSKDKHLRFQWTSRDNRKGRHTLVLSPEDVADEETATPDASGDFKHILSVIWRMLTYYPVWDISWLVAFIFTLGSVIWVINSFFDFLPFLDPSTDFPNEVLYGGGITAFIGATVFELGSIFLMLEAINENREGCFGWAIEQLYETTTASTTRIHPTKSHCTHHHYNRRNLVGRPATPSPSPFPSSPPNKSWTWYPTLHDLLTHHLHDLGFLACSAQMFGATIFWISGFTALPGIYTVLSPGLTAGIYWTPQVIGGSGFIVSGVLFMVETQRRWWVPALGTLGWWIGAWNLVGGVGFTLCPAFGYSSADWAQFQAACSTFWGSWAFLIGSVLQWYESLDKNPVIVDKEGASGADDGSDGNGHAEKEISDEGM